MYSYHLYDLTIHSHMPLPELMPTRLATADVVIRAGRLPAGGTGEEYGRPYAVGGAGDIGVGWPHLGRFLVRGQDEIIVDALPSADDRLVRLGLLGTVFAMLLQRRGLLVLHASAVAIQGQGVVFLGAKGQGKSTLAASLCSRGHRLLADDVVALDLGHADGPLVLAGFPQLKLWPDAATCVVGDATHLAQLTDEYEKLGYDVSGHFTSAKSPLRSIYVLAEGDRVRTQLLRPQEALAQLISHSFLARLGNAALQGSVGAAHFRQCAQVVHSTPLRVLERPIALERLAASAAAIESEVRGSQREQSCEVVECVPS